MINQTKAKWIGQNCYLCGARLNSWDARLCKSLAYKNKICESCIAKEYDMDIHILRARMEDFFDMRPCQGI